ncbi:MAG: 16S rRNA (guanine(527)-N(7))-methyltransferase RsmG [Dehalococcoidales bacterium]|nr:16S rRNA (guanine(527)-N(7))-methyltransferase RsmG [Dehalococcoidales bacterium]
MNILVTNAKKLDITITGKQAELFEVYYRELADWNNRVNLTSVTGYEEVQVKHFLDSLTVFSGFRKDKDLSGLTVLDVGTGAGFPGIPLKIVLPDIKLILIEATAKKTEFLKYIVSTLGLSEVEVLTGRAEELARIGKHRESYDVIVSRAVAPLAVLAEFTLPFCTVGGRCILPKKGDTVREIDQAMTAIETLGGKLSEVKKLNIEGLEDDRHLVIIDKVGPVPDKYPRRPGIPEKRPIQQAK